jgi:hypothetical protein
MTEAMRQRCRIREGEAIGDLAAGKKRIWIPVRSAALRRWHVLAEW